MHGIAITLTGICATQKGEIHSCPNYTLHAMLFPLQILPVLKINGIVFPSLAEFKLSFIRLRVSHNMKRGTLMSYCVA